MKKKKKFTESSVRYFNIYLNELEQIEQILGENFGKIEIDDDEEYFDNLDDLLKKYNKKKKINNLNFGPSDLRFVGELTIELRKDGAFFMSFGDEKMKGTRLLIEDILQNNPPKPKWFFNLFNKLHDVVAKSIFILIPLMVLIATVLIFSVKLESGEMLIDVKTNIKVFLMLFFSLSFIIGIFLAFKSNSIHLIERNSEEGFFSRNKDKIILTLMGVIAGALLTLGIKLILGQ